MGRQRRGQARMFGASSVEVRAEGDHDGGRARLARVHQGVEEATSYRFVATEGERLLELVDDEKRGRPRFERPSQLQLRVRARRHHRNGALPRPAKGRDEPGPYERRLPAAGRAYHGNEATGDELLDGGRDDVLAPEEQISVLGLERHQPAIRAGAG